jgi:cytochrome c peroxidase
MVAAQLARPTPIAPPMELILRGLVSLNRWDGRKETEFAPMKTSTRALLLLLALIGSVPGFLSSDRAKAAANTAPPTSNLTRAHLKQKYVRPASTPFPADNLYSKDRELLGKTLFFDPRLSQSGSIACASCHNPGFSWGDGLPRGIGTGMKQLGRRSPTILNAAWSDLLFWDGRADSLEMQALGPIASQREMNMPLDAMVKVLRGIPEYKALFASAYPGEPVNEKTVARAIASFERTVVSGQAPFDRWISGDESAVSEDAKRGFDLFNGKAGCVQCHSEWNFTDNGFHDVGLEDSDRGRGERLPLEGMQFAFKTPTLRNVDRRSPYMHEGNEQTLAGVIDFYDRGGDARRKSLSPEMVPLHLTAQEKTDLLAFLSTLTSVDKPVEFPSLPR